MQARDASSYECNDYRVNVLEKNLQIHAQRVIHLGGIREDYMLHARCFCGHEKTSLDLAGVVVLVWSFKNQKTGAC